MTSNFSFIIISFSLASADLIYALECEQEGSSHFKVSEEERSNQIVSARQDSYPAQPNLGVLHIVL